MRLRLLCSSAILILASACFPAAEVLAVTQVRTTGTATGTGTTHLTIESFQKPGDRDRFLGGIKTTFEFFVPVLAGWTCDQTTDAIRDSLVAGLPAEFQIAYVSPCTLSIQKQAIYDPFTIVIIENVPGQIIIVYDSAVPVEVVTWGRIKLAYGRSRR